MALNEIHAEANHLALPVAVGALAGAPQRIGILNAVLEVDASVGQVEGGVPASGQNANGYASVSLVGSWKLPVVGAVATKGAPIYIKTDNTLTATSTGNFLFGASLGIKGAGTGDLVVKILQPGQTVASA